MHIRTISKAVALTVGVMAAAFPASPAGAAQAEPPVSNTAWYWETQSSQTVTDPTSGGDVATIESPNPFCPSTSVGGPPQEAGTCKEGRLPVEVRNADYETPDKISAVAFDLSLVPIGSKVNKMTVRFLEANDEQSQPINAADKTLQACIVDEFFGGGDAREYDEMPDHSCSDSDPTATREQVQVKNEEGETVDRFAYTFDLTPHAVQWVEKGELQSSIMLYPVEPEQFDPSTDNNWRVVLSGPASPNGVVSNISYKPPADSGFGDFDFPDDTGSIGSTSGDFGTSSGSFGSTGSSGVSPTSSDTSGGGDEVAPEEETVDPTTLAAEPVADTAESLPAYVWLAILAGMIGFSLVRQVVLEGATGIRPDGVLAQIRRVNADRRGTTLDEEVIAGSGKLEPILKGLAELGGRASEFVEKMKTKFTKKG